MTDNERKQAEEILRNELNIARLSPLQFDGIMRSMKAFADLKVAEAIKGMYPKEFIEWAVINCRAEGNTSLWLYNYDDKTETYLNVSTTDELFEYWEQNINN